MLKRFLNNHGERLFFLLLTTAFGWFFFTHEMQGEGKTLLIAVSTLCLNKARSPKESNDEKVVTT